VPALAEVADYLDALLSVPGFPDFPNAVNGVEVETPADITAIATAVDARERTIAGAAAAGAKLLLVHHGLFWGGVQAVRGPLYRRLRAAFAADVGVYAAHLPLDAHPEFGNNPLLARALELAPSEGFARFEGIDVGVAGTADVATAELIARATAFSARFATAVRHTPLAAGRRTRRWAICTGAGADSDTLREAADRGIDTLIVGEGPHWSAIDAEELGIVLIYAGHYATEVLGVRALGEHVAERFGIPCTFLDAPTGL
jgi:dinuclear metal center YbgI/SA1388 family protein